MRIGLPLLLALAACGSSKIEGTLVDGLTNQPMAGVTVVAEAAGDASLTCKSFTGTTDASGAFTIDGACVSKVGYTLKVNDENLWIQNSGVPQGGFEGPQTITAWYAPVGEGLYVLSTVESEDGPTTRLDLISTSSVVESETILGTEDELVKYPAKIPPTVLTTSQADYIVGTTRDFCDNVKIYPLIQKQGRLTFAGERAPYMDDWWFIGVEFASDTEFERRVATWDPAVETRVEDGDRYFCFLPVSQLTPGRYAVMKPDEARTRLLDVTE